VDLNELRLSIDRVDLKQILSFGRWIFASSIVYFLAANFDRLYFAKVIPFVLLGIYGVARTYSDTAGLLIQRVGNLLIFPAIAASRNSGAELRVIIARMRGRALLMIAALLSVGIAGADRLILSLYDHRYHAAVFMLPILMLGVWFAILSTLGEAIMLGTGKPAHAARANTVKLIWTVVGLPLALLHGGLAMALLVIVSGDLVRYISLSFSQREHELSFVRQDISLTLGLIGLVLFWRIIFILTGLVPSLHVWWAYGTDLHG
jgi:O-antigen/teichoic acid export membrane protein